MDRLRGFNSVWTILFICSFSPLTCGKLILEDFEEKLAGLYKVVDYVHRRPHEMNADVTFSITIVEANIAATLLHKNARYLGQDQWKTLSEILQICDSTRRYLIDHVIPETKDVRLLHQMLNNPALWMRPISWQNGVLEKKGPTPGLTYRDVRDLIMQGTPKEEESDRCLGEIVRNELNPRCEIPETCVEILKRRDSTRGYPLAHRLLIIQVAKAMGCSHGIPSDLRVSYCSAIMQDLVDAERSGFPYTTPDLMMEQVLLCGMEGFLEFTGKHYERLLLDWSRPSGCYSSFGSKDNPSRVVRRTSSRTDFGCDSHATGLAAASLSLFIRENVENAFEEGLL
ncbi:uncharacterized protein LOC128895211 [Hylaeus anthracinus]|uniref:uncharacterized protein LOC128895211 n=1 Tax=Hylaeus anthracinus TaxID=313031 RepID=UPI0023B88E55|nr:uncharacterized protein LOC128895211 [Hylaeus anthracinus]